MFASFMINAWVVATIVAVIAGAVGFFVVLRGSAFPAHAIPNGAFAGAAGASLLGVNTLAGLGVFAVLAAVGIGVLGRRGRNDVVTALALVVMLALGAVFLSQTTQYEPEIFSLLFGEVLGISSSQVALTAEASAVILIATALIYRPLLFASLDEDVAEAKGLPMLGLGLAFMLLLAVTISIAVQIIGVLLIFALMVTPAAIAVRLTRRPAYAVLVAILVAVFATWAGLIIAFYEAPPASFFIVTIAFVLYVAVRAAPPVAGLLRGVGTSARRRRTAPGGPSTSSDSVGILGNQPGQRPLEPLT